VASEDEEVEADAGVAVDATTVDRRRVRRPKREVIRRENILSLKKRNPEDKEAVTTEEAVEVAEAEVEAAVVTAVARVPAVKDLVTSHERTRTTTRKVRVRDVKEDVVKEDGDEATPADDQDDSEDAQDDHQHRAQETKVATTVTTTAAVTNTLTTNAENATTIVVTEETEVIVEIAVIAESEMAIVMARDPDVADMDATEKS